MRLKQPIKMYQSGEVNFVKNSVQSKEQTIIDGAQLGCSIEYFETWGFIVIWNWTKCGSKA